VEVLKE
jgi:hypothetical protein